MKICFGPEDDKHCFEIPLVESPLGAPPTPGGPVNDPFLIYDATVIASAQAVANKASDQKVISALQGGITAALQILQRRGGNLVSFEG